MLLEEEKNLDLSIFSEPAIQKSLFNSALHHQLPVAAWRLPHQKQQHLIVDLSGKTRKVPLELESLPPGFIVSPFLNGNDPAQTSYIHADLYYNSDADAIKINPQITPAMMRADAFLQTCYAHLKKPATLHKGQAKLSPSKTNYNTTGKSHFLNLVHQAISMIEAGDFQKVVPSRKKIVDLPTSFDIVDTFHKLCHAYPAAFVSVFSIPGIGIWMGASPEILVSTSSQHEKKLFRTVALAGTQVKKEKDILKDTAWRQKEIEEQAMVSRYIINCFKKIRLREFDENGPKTVAAGNLIHLRTDFSVDMNATNFPELASVMLQLLHPTSAVCGMPKEPALAFLQQQEAYDREYFSGFLGPVNIMSDELHIFVNLRCMQLLSSHQAAVYSGAGITIDSDPEKEWKETEVKMNTLLKVILD